MNKRLSIVAFSYLCIIINWMCSKTGNDKLEDVSSESVGKVIIKINLLKQM